jgi:hypothetical protein
LKTYKKNRRKPKTTSPPIHKYSPPPGPWAKSEKEKVELFAEYLSEVFSPHNNDQDQEVEQHLATVIQSQERLKAFTLKEIKDEIKILNKTKKGTRFRPYYCQNVKRITKRRTRKCNVYIQRHTTTRILA